MDLTRELSDDVVNSLLTYIPTPDLCRLRTVSKRWNDLISNLDFAISHAKNHENRQNASFIVQHYIRRSTQSLTTKVYGWCILDVNARRWYRIEANYRHCNDVLLELRHIPIAMHGGLVCQHLKTEKGQISLIVHNPIGDYFKKLPLVPKHKTSGHIPGLSLVFDTIANTFKAFVINHNYNKTIKLNDPKTSEEERLRIRNDPMLRVYDSAKKEWQSLSNPDWDVSGVGLLCGSVIFQDHLVVLLSARTPPYHRNDPYNTPWTYSLADNKWKIMRAVTYDIDTVRYHPKLVVIGNRLFLVSWLQTDPWYRLSLEEISIPEMTLEQVCNLWEEQSDIRSGIRNDLTLNDALDGPGISVIGFGNSSLMVMLNSSGKCKVFDVVTLSWNADDLPQNPLIHVLDGRYFKWVGKHMNLLPPNWKLKTD